MVPKLEFGNQQITASFTLSLELSALSFQLFSDKNATRIVFLLLAIKRFV